MNQLGKIKKNLVCSTPIGKTSKLKFENGVSPILSNDANKESNKEFINKKSENSIDKDDSMNIFGPNKQTNNFLNSIVMPCIKMVLVPSDNESDITVQLNTKRSKNVSSDKLTNRKQKSKDINDFNGSLIDENDTRKITRSLTKQMKIKLSPNISLRKRKLNDVNESKTIIPVKANKVVNDKVQKQNKSLNMKNSLKNVTDPLRKNTRNTLIRKSLRQHGPPINYWLNELGHEDISKKKSDIKVVSTNPKRYFNKNANKSGKNMSEQGTKSFAKNNSISRTANKNGTGNKLGVSFKLNHSKYKLRNTPGKKTIRSSTVKKKSNNLSKISNKKNLTKLKTDSIIKTPKNEVKKLMTSFAKEVKNSNQDVGVLNMVNLCVGNKPVMLQSFGNFPSNLICNKTNKDLWIGVSISNKSFTSGVVYIKPGGKKPKEYPKKHDMYFFVLNGSILVEISSSKKQLRVGESFYIPHSVPYSLYNLSETEELKLLFVKYLPQLSSDTVI